ncbi:MAG: hypothetical protein AB7P50_08960 [Alphaproteobacteria bacterium]
MQTPNDMRPDFGNVGIYINAKTRDLLLAMAAELRRRHGARIHLYTRGPEEARFFAAWTGPKHWDTVTDAVRLGPAVGEAVADAASLIARARAFEARIGRPIAELSFSHRHLGRGYFLGGFRHPRASYYDDASYAQTLNAYVRQLEFWDAEIDAKGLTLLLHGDNIAQAIAAARGVPARYLISARYQTQWFWASDQYQTNPLFEAAWASAQPDPSLSIGKAYTAATVKNAEFDQWMGLATVMRHTVLAAATMAWWRLRKYQKARAYNFVDYVTWPFRQYLGLREARRRFRTRLADLSDVPVVYFPLHKEPEESFLLRSPERFSQHAVIAGLSRALPAGAVLAVKENRYAVARRPRDFYAQIAALKNVVLLDIAENGVECVKRADVVATMAGTAGLEAAALGKPVVLFSAHMPIGVLPHVFTVADDADLPGLLRAALAGEGNAARAALDGSKFLAAVKASSFDLGGFHYAAPGQVALDPNWIEAATAGLEASLRPSSRAGHKAA